MGIKAGLLALLGFFVVTELNTCQAGHAAEGNFTVIGSKIDGATSFTPPPSPYTVNIQDKAYTTSFEVNTCGGEITFKSGNRVTVSNTSCTEACCDSEYANQLKSLMDQFTTYSEVDDTDIILDGPEGSVWLRHVE